MADAVVMHGLKLVEVGTLAGPMIYRVDVLWYPSSGWRTDLTTPDRVKAIKRYNELQDGLDAHEKERVIAKWMINGNVGE